MNPNDYGPQFRFVALIFVLIKGRPDLQVQALLGLVVSGRDDKLGRVVVPDTRGIAFELRARRAHSIRLNRPVHPCLWSWWQPSPCTHRLLCKRDTEVLRNIWRDIIRKALDRAGGSVNDQRMALSNRE